MSIIVINFIISIKRILSVLIKNKNKIKYIFSLFLILFLLDQNDSYINQLFKDILNKKKIFTFWEPHEKIPGYIRLCIETWKKNLPEYEIIILDYKSLKNYLSETLLSKIICKNMSIAKQADAIRVALLKIYGGIWMDADTIIINGEFLKGLENFELAMIGKGNVQNIGFIFSRINSTILNDWLKIIIIRVNKFKQTIKKVNFQNELKNFYTWNYLGNGIIDCILTNVSATKFKRINRDEINALPEIKYFNNSSFSSIRRYIYFYFQKRDLQSILNNSKSILLLHNSWSPSKYKKMSQQEFLKQDILLSRLLKHILNKY